MKKQKEDTWVLFSDEIKNWLQYIIVTKLNTNKESSYDSKHNVWIKKKLKQTKNLLDYVSSYFATLKVKVEKYQGPWNMVSRFVLNMVWT